MKYALVIAAVFISQASFAQRVGNKMSQVAGRTLTCGKTTLHFSRNAQAVQVNGGRATIQWGNGGIDAVITPGGDLNWDNDQWYLDEDLCTAAN